MLEEHTFHDSGGLCHLCSQARRLPCIFETNGKFPSQSTAMFTVHTVTQYVNTITHVSVYTPYRDLCNTHPMRINRNRFDMSAGPCTIHVFPVKSFI